jgi:hypothetical protein
MSMWEWCENDEPCDEIERAGEGDRTLEADE